MKVFRTSHGRAIEGAGDIDLFLVDGDCRPAAEEGDRIAREVLQLDVVRHGNEHHSSNKMENNGPCVFVKEIEYKYYYS